MGTNFLKKFKIKKKILKKNIFLLKNIQIRCTVVVLQNFFSPLIKAGTATTNNFCHDSVILTLSQKIFNTKGTIFIKKNLNTFSIGSVIKHFKVKQGKYIRRSLKGTKIFLNFFKNVFIKKYTFLVKGGFIFKINGFDYNMYAYKTFYKNFYKNLEGRGGFFIYNVKIPFTKIKNKKVKSIKKRLKKKIFLNFVKNVK